MLEVVTFKNNVALCLLTSAKVKPPPSSSNFSNRWPDILTLQKHHVCIKPGVNVVITIFGDLGRFSVKMNTK
jgi:hypothetical protein